MHELCYVCSFHLFLSPRPIPKCSLWVRTYLGQKVDAFHYWQNIIPIWKRFFMLFPFAHHIHQMNEATGNQLMDPFKPFHIRSFYHNKLFVGFSTALWQLYNTKHTHICTLIHNAQTHTQNRLHWLLISNDGSWHPMSRFVQAYTNCRPQIQNSFLSLLISLSSIPFIVETIFNYSMCAL